MSNVCLVSLIGLPAAGKTSFCKEFLQFQHNLRLVHMCYDDFFHYSSNESMDYKNDRRKWLEMITDRISTLPTDIRTVLLVDDNNYYTSMRYEIFKLSRNFKTYYAQLYFPISVDVSIERNLLRDLSVPQDVIERMNAKLEPPSARNLFEKNTFIVEEWRDLSEISNFLNSIFGTPLEVASETFTPLPQTKMHLYDLFLRRKVSEVVLESKQKGENVGALANRLNTNRRQLLDDLKGGLVVVDDDLDRLRMLLLQ